MPAGNALGSAGRDTGDGNDDDVDENEARYQGEADGELEIECPGVDGVPVVAVGVNPEVGTGREARIGTACELRTVVLPLLASERSHEEAPTWCWRISEYADCQRRLLFHEGSGGRLGRWDSSTCDEGEPDEVALHSRMRRKEYVEMATPAISSKGVSRTSTTCRRTST